MTGAVRAPGQWAGATVLLTWGVLGLAVVAALCGRRTRRAACLGATAFGVGYMLLVAGQPVAIMTDVNNRPWTQVSTNRLLNALRPWVPKLVSEFPPASDGVAFANARILRALERTVPMRFPQETPLKKVLEYIAASTRDPDGYKIPVYVDPDALRDVEKSIESPVTIDLDGVPLRTSLDLVLNQLDLSYTVKGGVLVVNDEFGQVPLACNDPFLTIGQCLLALFAAGVGSVLAGLVHNPRDERATRTPGGAGPLT
jgi:hypothetical protein